MSEIQFKQAIFIVWRCVIMVNSVDPYQIAPNKDQSGMVLHCFSRHLYSNYSALYGDSLKEFH